LLLLIVTVFFFAAFVAGVASRIQPPTMNPNVARRMETILLITLCLLIIVAKHYRRLPPNQGEPLQSGAGGPVPRDPSPSHHLVAAKAFPPSEKTHLYPKD
jgi:hypothetical protein